MLKLTAAIRAVFVIIFLAASHYFTGSTAVSAQLDLIQEVAAYSRQVNQITQQFAGIVQRTIEYDNLAYDVLEGEVEGAAADRRLSELSKELWALHERGKGQLEALPAPPASIERADHRVRIENIRAMAVASEEMARSSISSGEELVQAAIAGDEDVFNRIEIRSTELVISQLRQQSALYDVHLSNDNDRQFNYYLTAAMKSETEALIAILGSTVERLRSDHATSMTQIKPEVQAWIDQGLAYIETGRKVTRNALAHYRSAKPKNAAERHLQAVLIEILEGNAPRSFEVEAQILREIAGLGERDFALEEDELDAFTVRLSGLERERARLVLERQQRLAAPQ